MNPCSLITTRKIHHLKVLVDLTLVPEPGSKVADLCRGRSKKEMG
jgi:hypothetical protein